MHRQVVLGIQSGPRTPTCVGTRIKCSLLEPLGTCTYMYIISNTIINSTCTLYIMLLHQTVTHRVKWLCVYSCTYYVMDLRWHFNENQKSIIRFFFLAVIFTVEPATNLLVVDHWGSLQHCTTRTLSTIHDVWDGLALRPAGRFFSTPYHLAGSLSTDGVPLFKSSSISMWPVYLVILNLPAKV